MDSKPRSGGSNLTNSNIPSHYVGVGASAGGLEALQLLLRNLPTETGACFIIVQHLSPDFKSMMLELLSKHTSMELINVKDTLAVKSNTIYLIPPKRNMKIIQGQLLLSDKVPESGLNLPIDIFFRSLAEDQQHKAIGIVLSGTGSDGSRGIKTLKEAGALTIVQDPESAKFDGMPKSALNTGVIDLIVRPEEIGAKLDSYIQHPLVSGAESLFEKSINENEDAMSEIFNVLKAKSEIDFAKYKPSTVARRIERRMTIKQVQSLQEYLTILYKEPYEIQVLSRELLIGVTRFFRDSDAFDELRNKIIPSIVKSSAEDTAIRIWVAGCSTGEEAFSLAILFYNEIEKQKLKREVKVFATDVNGDAVSEASNGIYGEDISHDILAEHLTNHFTKTPGNSYQVNKNIRQMVIFATHNVIVDPPFSNMDLVTCRNLLIYFQHSVQKRVLTSLHFALRKDGFLFLGSSENLGDVAPHFEVVNERCRLYKKRSSVRIPVGSAPPSSNTMQPNLVPIPSIGKLMRNYRGNTAGGSALGFANEKLITQYAPPCILLNDDHEALHVYGNVSPFVRRLPPGRISVDIKDMVNEDISIAVSSALHRAKQTSEEVRYTDVFTQIEDTQIALDLIVSYIKEHDVDSSPGYYWVIFQKIVTENNEGHQHSVPFDASEQARQRIEDLELELKRNKENLQVTVEELETTNEELQSANEELMSANEELQSTNEELQSVNEELYTVNSEYQEKITEITQANNDLDEVLDLSKIGIIFLDENMLIRRYTQAASNYINLLDTDINRPLHHISSNIGYTEIEQDVSEVFSKGITKNVELVLEDKRVINITVIPYSYEDALESKGAAVTFADVSQVKYMEKAVDVVYNEFRKSINNALDSLDLAPFKPKVNALIVDDYEAEIELIATYLEEIKDFNVEVFRATTSHQAFKIALSKTIDVCLVDYNLGRDTAIDFANMLKEKQVDFPTIVITGDSSKQLDTLLLSQGIVELLNKDEITSPILSRAIRHAIRRKEIDSQSTSETQIYSYAYLSKATNKFNEHDLDQLVNDAAKNNEAFGITGYLYQESDTFFQYIEGEKSELNRLIENLHRDSRHTIAEEYYFNPMRKRIFPDWSMRQLKEDESLTIIEKSLIEAFRKLSAEKDASNFTKKQSIVSHLQMIRFRNAGLS